MVLGEAGVMGEKELTVRIPGLVLLPEASGIYEKVGGDKISSRSTRMAGGGS